MNRKQTVPLNLSNIFLTKNSGMFYELKQVNLRKQDNTALKHKILQEDSLQARQHSSETQGFLQKDSLQARQHSIET